MRTKEPLRKTAHFSSAAFIFLLKYLPQLHVILVGIAISLLYYTAIMTQKDLEKDAGIWLYPLPILFFITAFPNYIAAGLWAVYAFGDAYSTILGSSFGKTKLHWNKRKTYLGLLAFVTTATISSIFFMMFINPELSIPFVFAASFLASAVCALAESLPLKINDNIVVPSIGALFFLLVT